MLYTGDGTSSNAITGVGFQPDFLWIKQRDATRGHQLMDSVRGTSVRLQSHGGTAESASALVSFDSDGFTVTHTINASNDGGTIRKATHYSGNNYVAWNWLAGGTASSNTDGTITSTVSANTTSGFSIVSYTGTGANASIGHGLGVAPAMYIVKNRDAAQEWTVYHHKNTSEPETEYLDLNDTGATTDLTYGKTLHLHLRCLQLLIMQE